MESLILAPISTLSKDDVLLYMEEALNECENAINLGEVPVGCVFLHMPSRKIIARGHNLSTKTKNATTHAEINCINAIYKILKDSNTQEEFLKKYDIKDKEYIFSECILFVSCEPCIMCAYALSLVSMN